ncbi:MAG TPA: ImmA/IrrE family metallo-endopeptidase, partial [Steroidobacteraceae bacterium]|nr:ImmA/IrrE family metallo-endopeptidase [Steroidobacteraceae bacterium]
MAAPLDPWRLAAFLEIPLIPLSEFLTQIPNAAGLLLRQHRAAFSAVTVFCGCERVIVYNDGHSRARQASDIAHELGHALLHHPAKPAFDGDGQRNWDPELEREAEWLGGALL